MSGGEGTSPVVDALPEGLRLNQIQFIATHNSSHMISRPDERYALLMGGDIDSYRYAHEPIEVQLGQQRVRGLELDLYPDPTGGRYAYPLPRRWRRRGPLTDPSWYRPGFKVMHAPDADYRSNCPDFAEALRRIRAWSRANPRHTPIVIQLEIKHNWPWSLIACGARVPRWTAARFDQLDAVIAEVFGDDVITPDSVRRRGATLRESVCDGGWPLVDDVRGQVMFWFDYGNNVYVRDRYRQGRPNLEGRMVFTTPEPGQPDSAVVMRPEPRGDDGKRIAELVRAGYFVRTRADDSVATPRANEHGRARAALDCGAQMISTDFPVPGMAFRWGDGTFVAQLPGEAAVRVNPQFGTASGVDS